MALPFANAQELGLAIKRARLSAGQTQSGLGKKLATTGKRVGRWEAGDTSSLGKTPEAQFAVAAQVAAATGDLSLIGVTDPQREADILTLQRDVARLNRQLRRVADILVQGRLLPEPELPLLLEEIVASDEPPAQGHDAGEGQSHA